MNKINFLLILIPILCLNATICKAQAKKDTTATYRIVTNDGNVYTGKIISDKSDSLKIKTNNIGIIILPKTYIRKMNQISTTKLKKEGHWPSNPESARYFWEPDGYGLKTGEGYYQNVWVLFNQAKVGISDNFTVGLGLVPLFFFDGAPTPIWVAPKISIPIKKDKFNIGAGALFGTIIDQKNSDFGILYGVATLGSRDQNINFGIGYGYSNQGWSKMPTFSISGMFRIGPNGYFITENYIVGINRNYFLLATFGGRYIIKYSGIEFGLALPVSPNTSAFVVVPWLGLTVPFGKISH